MIGGLEFITEWLFSVDTLAVIIVLLAGSPFGAKGFDLYLIVEMILQGLLSVWFYYLGSDWDWSFPFKLVILCVILLALQAYSRINTARAGLW